MKPMAASDRMVWFDANRSLAAFGVVLIHCTTDFAGQPFAAVTSDQRIVPELFRSIADISGAEMFFVFSLFLLAFKLDRRDLDFVQTMKYQAQRLLVPFFFWTLFYPFYRLAKASAFGYTPSMLDELGQWTSWSEYFLLGTAQYHLHFLPTLFALALFYPVMRVATRYPVAGLAVFGLLGAMDYVQGYLWGTVGDPVLRDYLLRVTKILGYVGYGFAAFAIYGFWKPGLPQDETKLLGRAATFLAVFAFVATLPYAAQAIATGAWPVRQGWDFYAHFLMPLFVFVAFMGAQYASWSPNWSRLARFTLGIYLVHPIFVDLYDIVVFTGGLTPAPTVMVITKFVLVAPAALGLAFLLSRTSLLAWTIGLGPVPWRTKGRGAAPVEVKV